MPKNFLSVLLKKIKKKQTSGQLKGQAGKIPEGIRIPASLQEKKKKIQQILGESNDIIIREFQVGGKDGIAAAVLWVDGMVDKQIVNNSVIRSLFEGAREFNISNIIDERKTFEAALKNWLTTGDVTPIYQMDKLIYSVLSGETAFLLDGFPEALLTNTPGWEKRSIEEPASEVLIRGPRDGFTETIRVNTTLVRRRLKNPNLRIENLNLGKETQTDAALVYIQGIANEEVLKEVRKRLGRITTDAILESAYIEEMIEDAPFSLFPTTIATERPDVVAAALLEGRIGIILDGTPFVLIVPTLFFQLFQTPEDYYTRYPLATFSRWLRLVGLLITMLLPALYIAITTYHPEVLPRTLLLTITASREGIPFPAFLEALLMEVTFEALREAGVRMPRPVGQAVSIVGALVLGEAAISAGIVSPAMVVIVATTAIVSFLIPNIGVTGSVRLLRFGMMVMGAVFGLFGLLMGAIAINLHLISLRSFGVPYMWPLAPLNVKALKDTLIRAPHWLQEGRPDIFSWQDTEDASQSANNKPQTR